MKDRSLGVFVVLVMVIAGTGLIRGKQDASTVQAPVPARQGSADETATGQLLVVDAAKRTITIAVEGGAQQIFKYTDDTRMTGAQGGIAELSAMTGRQARVHYTMDGVERILTSIEVASAPAK